MRTRRFLAAGALAALACIPSSEEPGPNQFTVVVGIPSRSLNAIGDTLTLGLTVTDHYGNVTGSVPVVWTSASPGVATAVDGLVTAHRNGFAKIFARVESDSAMVQVTVQQIPVGLAKLSGDSQSGIIDHQLAQPLQAMVQDRLGHPVAGVLTSFTPLTGGGLPTGTGQVTDSTGITAVVWTLGDTVEHQLFAISMAARADTFLARAGDGLDSLPSATATAQAVVESLFATGSYAVSADCAGNPAVDCPGGAAAPPVPITVTEDSVAVQLLSPGSYGVTMFVAIATDTIPVHLLSTDCKVTFNSTADTVPIQVAIPVHIDSLVAGDPPDRASIGTLTLTGVQSKDVTITGAIGCSTYSGSLSFVPQILTSALSAPLIGSFCGAPGPALLEPCPPVGSAGLTPPRIRFRSKLSGGATPPSAQLPSAWHSTREARGPTASPSGATR
ncbi:MAG TPA: hypothetical protein VJN62_07795 [Gemmatimonadales bacterium]|nr:hypothetical protein [Gemmatimonadales bacterium]